VERFLDIDEEWIEKTPFFKNGSAYTEIGNDVLPQRLNRV
jgi:hypothetical protein